MSMSSRMRFWLAQILSEIKSQYTTLKDPSITELSECGPDVLGRLSESASAILAAAPIPSTPPAQNKNIVALRSPKGSLSAPPSPKSVLTTIEYPSTMDLATARTTLYNLRDESLHTMRSVHHSQVSTSWRRLFTDSSLLLVLADLTLEPRRGDYFYKDLIGILDEVIVIANAPGTGRLDMCHDAIARIQEEYVPLNDPACASSTSGGPSFPYPVTFEDTSAPPDLRASKRPKRSVRNGLSTPSSTTSTPILNRTSPLLPTASRSIPRLIDPPSVIEYRERYYDRPFIVPRYAADWRACANWGNPQYLRNVGGLGRKVPVEKTIKSGDDYTSDTWSNTMMDWETFIDLLCIRSTFSNAAKVVASLPHSSILPAAGLQGSRSGTPVAPAPDAPKRRGRPPLNRNLPPPPVSIVEWPGETFYLAQHDLINQIPELRGDIIVPDYVYGAVSAPPWFPDYQPPAVEGMVMINNWIGPKGTITPPHKDPYYNCYVQVVGRKTVWLAPPEFDEEMYPYPSTPTPSSHASSSHTKAGGSSSPPSRSSSASSPLSSSSSNDGTKGQSSATSSSVLHNTSRVKIFKPEEDSKNKFPLFYAHVQPHALSAVLEPGDLLVFPPGWWHAMRSEETSASVSLWF